MIAELVAEAADVHFYEVRTGIEARAPHAREQLGASDDLLCVVHEVEEQRVFAGGEVERDPRQAHLATDPVELDGADPELREAGRATDERPNARHELFDLEGLHQVVVGAGLESKDALAELAAGGEHQDRGGHPSFTELAADREAVDVGEHPVEDDEVVDPRWGLRERLRPGGRCICRKSFFDEDSHQETRELHVVLDDQDFHKPRLASLEIDAASEPTLQTLNERLTPKSRGDAKLRPVMMESRLYCCAVLAAVVALSALPRAAHADEATPPADGAQTAAAPAQSISLADAIASARTRGYDVLIASSAVNAAEADVRIAGQPPNPAIQAGPSRRLDCSSGPGCPGPWGLFASLSDQGLIEGAITRKRALRADVAKRALDAAKFGRANAERVLVAQLKVQYVQTAAAQARVDLAREVAVSLQKSVDINRVRYPRVIDEGQLARVEQEAMRAQQEVDSALRQQRQEQIELSILMGNSGAIPEIVVDRKVLDFRVPDALASLDKTVLLKVAIDNRPDRKQAVAQVAQYEAAVTLAERQRFPDMSLLVQYQQLGSGDNAPQPPTLSVGVGLPLPIFYQQQGEISKAEAERQTALVTRRRLGGLVGADLESAVNTFATARRIVERYESALLERAKRARDITQVQFNAGSATLTDLLDAQRSYVAVNSGYYTELVNYWTAVFLLEQAVGKELVR